MTARAKAYYDRYLKLHGQDDDLRVLEVKLALKALGEPVVIKDRPALPIDPRAGEGRVRPPVAGVDRRQVDLLSSIRLPQYRIKGDWTLVRGELGVTREDVHARVRVPWRPTGSYVLMVKFDVHGGKGGPDIYLPAGHGMCSLALRSGKTAGYLGLWTVDDRKTATGAIGSTRAKLNRGANTVTVHVTMRGQDAEISATLNGKLAVRWKGRASRLSNTQLTVKSLGLCASYCVMTFKSADLKVISGELRPAD